MITDKCKIEMSFKRFISILIYTSDLYLKNPKQKFKSLKCRAVLLILTTRWLSLLVAYLKLKN